MENTKTILATPLLIEEHKILSRLLPYTLQPLYDFQHLQELAKNNDVVYHLLRHGF